MISIKEWKTDIITLLNLFVKDWAIENARDKNKFPVNLGSKEVWDEQFSIFVERARKNEQN
ncbi:MAG TPA: hypothetical protein VGB37_05210 [Candidatus Lokiarchaeia archaeon]